MDKLDQPFTFMPIQDELSIDEDSIRFKLRDDNPHYQIARNIQNPMHVGLPDEEPILDEYQDIENIPDMNKVTYGGDTVIDKMHNLVP